MTGADTDWIITATVLALLIPLADLTLFLAGPVWSRNELNVFTHCYHTHAKRRRTSRPVSHMWL